MSSGVVETGSPVGGNPSTGRSLRRERFPPSGQLPLTDSVHRYNPPKMLSRLSGTDVARLVSPSTKYLGAVGRASGNSRRSDIHRRSGQRSSSRLWSQPPRFDTRSLSPTTIKPALRSSDDAATPPRAPLALLSANPLTTPQMVSPTCTRWPCGFGSGNREPHTVSRTSCLRAILRYAT